MIKTIIFDFDDTLEDFTSAHKVCVHKLMDYFYENHGIQKKKTKSFIKQLNRKYVRMGWKTSDPKWLDRKIWFSDFSTHFSLDLSKREIDVIVDMYWKIILDEVVEFKGAKDVLNGLSKKYALLILSDSDGGKKIKMDRIDKLSMKRFFSAIITSDDTKKNKPSLHNYNYIFNKFKILPDECVMIGDKPEFDLLPAKRFGLKTIWVKRGWWARLHIHKRYSYVDNSVTQLRKLPRIIESIEKKK